jgi:hypothetical protein
VTDSRRLPWAGLWSAFLAVLVIGPLLIARGFAINGDMVFVPHQPWKDQWLAADGSVPRAVPSDALVSIVTMVLPGDILQKVVLLLMLASGAWGIARLVEQHGWVAQCAAVSLFVWNPFVYERLAIGHWALLCGYAALPWVVLGAAKVRDDQRGAITSLAVPVLVASWTSPTGGALASLVALAIVVGRPRIGSVIRAAALCVALNLPWIVPGLLAPRSIPADPMGVKAFAATADSPLGTLGSLVTFGGLWKTSVAAPGRSSWFLALLALALVASGLAGLVRRQVRRDRTVVSLAAVSVLGLLLAWLPSTSVALPWFETTVVNLPGGGLVRDSAKWVVPFIVLVCLGLGALVGHVGGLMATRGVPSVSLIAVALLPLAILPGLAWGEFGRMQPVSYPAEWTSVANVIARSGAEHERIVVLPFEIYRRFPWNGERAVLDPAPRFFRGDVLVNDALPVGGGAVVAGEDAAAARVASASRQSSAQLAEVLRTEHVSWVLIEKDTPGASTAPAVTGQVVHDGPALRLVDVGPVSPPPKFGHRLLVLVIDGGVGLVGLAFLAVAAVRRTRGYTPA